MTNKIGINGTIFGIEKKCGQEFDRKCLNLYLKSRFISTFVIRAQYIFNFL